MIEYIKIHESLNLPLLKTSAFVAAWSKDEEDRFTDILKKGADNGVKDLCHLSKKEISNLEPDLAKHIRSAILVPREYVIDPWSAPLAYLKQALKNGGQALFNAEVTKGQFNGYNWLLTIKQGKVKAGYVINCAGLYGDNPSSLRASAIWIARICKGDDWPIVCKKKYKNGSRC